MIMNTGTGILETAQIHLHAQHTFAPAAGQEQQQGKLEPRGHPSSQPIEATVEEVLAAKNVS